MPRYSLEKDGGFVIRNDRRATPFSSFLPGIAGPLGIPLWAFYVNRGQGICGFGVGDKDRSIMEFFPADKAYQEVGFRGFRTFFKLRGQVFEPFSETGVPGGESMTVYPDRLVLRSEGVPEGFSVEVTYFTLPGESAAALCRKTVITNGSGAPEEIEVLDGLACLIPCGVGHAEYKAIGNTLKAWMDVSFPGENIPFFRLRSSTQDSETVTRTEGGFFCLSTVDGIPEKPVVDPAAVFGQNTALTFPEGFAASGVPMADVPQYPYNKVPCAFVPARTVLKAGDELVVRTLIGYADDAEQLCRMADRLTRPGFFGEKQEENRRLIEDLTAPAACRTADPVFDAYVRQCFLDNLIRSGKPVRFPSDGKLKIFYLYSRKHGDLERDYNDFSMETSPFPQGNANFRDLCQSRRCDCLFYPETETYNILLFAELIQADGYNPLSVNGSVFRISPDALDAALSECGITGKNAERLRVLLRDEFTPGTLLRYCLDPEEEFPAEPLSVLNAVAARAVQDTAAEFSEGYWTDHWTYLLDLIEKYLAVYPERAESLLFGETCRFYRSPAYVVPRGEKYTAIDGRPRQLNAVRHTEDEGGWMKTSGGGTFTVTLYAKLLLLALIKFATQDPGGTGIEMEAGKPGWNDSLNGLPSLFGSSVPELIELKRLCGFLLDHADRGAELPEEGCELFADIRDALAAYPEEPDDRSDFAFWDRISSARERYRLRVLNTFAGKTVTMEAKFLRAFLRDACRKLDSGLKKAVRLGGGFCPTYLRFEPVGTSPDAFPLPPAGFRAAVLPHFLEGPARLLRISDRESAAEIVRSVEESDLYDRKLKMFKISGPLGGLPPEIGRAAAFTPGFFENESVFLHMEYKYLLGVLHAGLYPEFFRCFKACLIPFLDPETYGRSTLENSSFLASGANPDPALHGRGFVARLSGSNVELLDLWSVMTAGERPFSVRGGELTLQFRPVLPGRLFDEAGLLSFRFLGKVDVACRNPGRRDLPATPPEAVCALFEDGSRTETGGGLSGGAAAAVRDGRVRSLELLFR